MVDNWNISKLTGALLPGKFIFVLIWGKKTQSSPRIGVFGFFETFWNVFPGNNLKWKIILYFDVYLHAKNRLCHSSVPHLEKFWFSSYVPKCCWPIKLQDSLKCNISRKKWMTKSIFGMQINIEMLYKLILSFECALAGMHKVPKIKKLHIFARSP